MTVKDLGSIVRTWPWRIAAALVVACLLAVGGWVFAQDKPPAPAAPAAPAAAPAPPPSKPDPAGTATGGIGDVTAKTAGKPTLEEVADFAGHNRVSINIMWTLFTGFLVMFMQAGFALVETGFTRAKNVAHTMMMNFMIYAIGMTGYWIMGFALHMGGLGAISTMGGTGLLDSEFTISLFGKDFGLFGMKGFFLAGSTYDVAVFALFLFQMVFMDTAATIPTGAMAERWKFSSFVVYGFFISMISYPIFANWVWGAIFAMFYMWIKYGKPDPSMMVNGMLAGLVAITAPCAFVSSFWAFFIGAVSGVLVCWAAVFIETVMRVDDPVGAIAVHGVNGAWGVLSLGLFSDGTYGDGFNGVEGTVRGLFYGGASQFVAQIIGTVTCFVFIFGASWVFFKAYDVVFGMRVSPEVEMEGLDVPEMGAHGYPEVQGPATLVHALGASMPKSPAMTMAPERSR